MRSCASGARTSSGRKDTLEKIQSAAGELETRLAEIDGQDARLQQLLVRTTQLTEALREHAFVAPMATDHAIEMDLPLFDDVVPANGQLQRQA